MKRLLLILLASSAICSVMVHADSQNNNHRDVIYRGSHAIALLDESFRECANYITTSLNDFVFMSAAFDTEIRRQLLSGCSSFNSDHRYGSCQNPEAFAALVKPYIDSMENASGNAKNILYLAVFQHICHNQPLIYPEGNATAVSLYHIVGRKTALHSSVANQPVWVPLLAFAGLFLSCGFIVVFEGGVLNYP